MEKNIANQDINITEIDNLTEIDISTKVLGLLGEGNKSSRFSIYGKNEEVYYKRNDSSKTSLDIVTTKNGDWDKHYVLDEGKIKVGNYGDPTNKTIVDSDQKNELLNIINSSSTLLTEKKGWVRTVEHPDVNQNDIISYKDKTFAINDGKLTGDIY